MKRKFKVPKWIAYCLPVLFLIVLEFVPAYRNADNTVKDLFYQSAGQTDPSISLIGIDEETLKEYGSFEVWSRSKLADLIEYLMEDPETAPKVIAIDIGMYSPRDAKEDARLIEAVKKAGNVVLVSSASFETAVIDTGDGFSAVQRAGTIEEPFDELKEAAVATGHSNVFLDDDGYARHAMGSLSVEGKKVSSFAYEAAKLFSGIEDPRFDRTNGRFYIAYSGLPGDYFGILGSGTSLKKVLEGKVPRQIFRNSLVFVGAYASGMQDNYFITSNHARIMNGVEIHANIAAQIINGWYYSETGIMVRLLLTIIFGVLSGIILQRLTYQKGLLISVLVSAGYIGAAVLLFKTAYLILPVLSPVLAMMLPCLIRTVVEYLNVYQERQRMVANFSRYMPKSVAEKVAKVASGGQEENAFPGEMKDIAVLFVDIRGFTTLSESMGPDQVANMINSFLSVTTTSIFRFGGTIDKFIGDCTMALFNAPMDQDDYVFKAICAGLDMQKYIHSIPVDPLHPEKKVRAGVGIECGSAMVGNIGTKFRMDYTAIGDTVNTASRIEGKAGPDEVLISENVYERVKDRIECEYVGGIQLKGKKLPQNTYRVTGVKEYVKEWDDEKGQ